MIRTKILFALLILQFLLPQEPKAQNTITREFFGFDFWSSDTSFWNEVFTQMNADTVQFGLMGMNNFKWSYVEPNPPSGSMHTYSWTVLDNFVSTASQAGIKLEFSIMASSSWGTLVADSDMVGSPCCNYSPLKPDSLSDTLSWGMTAAEAWYDFIFNMVERYDYDGVNDMPGLAAPGILNLIVGDEPEAPDHFYLNGGNIALYEQLLQVTYTAANAADTNIMIVRGKSNPAHIFDDNPDSTTLWTRRAPYMDSLKVHFSMGGNYFNIYAINFNDHYTGLAPLSNWLNQHMLYYGFQKPLMVADARTSLYPRGNSYPPPFGFALPKIYPDSFMIIMEDPSHPQYNVNKKIHQADEVNQSLRKVIMALATNQKHISLQPVYSSSTNNAGAGDLKPMWLYCGLFDPYIYETTNSLALAREPLYWTMNQIMDELIGANKIPVSYSLGNYVHAYKFDNNGTDKLFIWKDNPFLLDTSNLMARNQDTIVNLSSIFSTTQVTIKRFVSQVNSGNPVYLNDTIVNTTAVPINEVAVMVIANPSSSSGNYPNAYSISVKVFPNPASGEITINIPGNSANTYEIKIMDMYGRTLSQEIFLGKNYQLDAKNYSDGVYFYRVTEKETGKTADGKIILN